MQRFFVLLAIVVLAGCAAKNPVLHQSEWEKLPTKPRGAVVFSLPQARFDLTYQFVSRAFKSGPFTNVADYCLDPSYAATQSVCAELVVLGIDKPMRLSDRKKNFTAEQLCRKDGGKTEFRRGIADGSAVVISAVPDPAEVYLIPLIRSYFQTFEMSLEVNPNGTVGKGSLSTENLGADELMGLFAKLGTEILANAAANVTPQPILQRQAHQAQKPAPPTAAELKAARAELKRLAGLIARRDTLAAQNKDNALVSRSVLISAIDGQIARAKSAFLGAVTEKLAPPLTYAWIPAGPDVLAFATEESYDVCGETPVERPRSLALAAMVPGKAGLAPLASGNVTADSLPEATGWPYRIPREANVGWAECPSYDESLGGAGQLPDATQWTDIDKSKCEGISALRTLIPQFGPTLRLPAKTGGRKSIVAPEYYADGSLKKVSVSHVGTSPVPFITAAQGVLLPPAPPAPPTETATLQSEVALITARQALCRLVLNVGAEDPRCLGPNPPTTPEGAGN